MAVFLVLVTRAAALVDAVDFSTAVFALLFVAVAFALLFAAVFALLFALPFAAAFAAALLAVLRAGNAFALCAVLEDVPAPAAATAAREINAIATTENAFIWPTFLNFSSISLAQNLLAPTGPFGPVFYPGGKNPLDDPQGPLRFIDSYLTQTAAPQ